MNHEIDIGAFSLSRLICIISELESRLAGSQGAGAYLGKPVPTLLPSLLLLLTASGLLFVERAGSSLRPAVFLVVTHSQAQWLQYAGLAAPQHVGS